MRASKAFAHETPADLRGRGTQADDHGASEPYRTPLTLAAFTGARVSERLGLTWADVRLADLDDAELEFAWQVDRQGRRQPTKTDGSGEGGPVGGPGTGAGRFRGIATLTALGLIAEIGDFARFANARGLMSWLGMTPSGCSSGQPQHRGHITRAGNTHARRLLVEAAWHYRHPPHHPPL